MSDNLNMVEVEKDTAIAAVREAAFTDSDGRVIVHSFLNAPGMMLGADWDLDDVIEEIHKAEALYWFDDFMGHDLALITLDHKAYKFQVKRPAS